MSIGLIFIMSLAVVLAFLVTSIRFLGFKRVLRHATLIDVVFSVVICIALAGTLTGLLIGIVAGLLLAATLTALKWAMGVLEQLRGAAVQRIHAETEDWCPGGTPTRL